MINDSQSWAARQISGREYRPDTHLSQTQTLDEEKNGYVARDQYLYAL